MLFGLFIIAVLFALEPLRGSVVFWISGGGDPPQKTASGLTPVYRM
jgi:hypothetical protein